MKRRGLPGLLLAAVVALTNCGPALAAGPALVNVRIEGATQTLFEGPVQANGGYIQASSDDQARLCNGTNNDENPTPGATATIAAVDAMQSVGQTFDGQWYPDFDDYFITRWGPDSQNANAYDYWGILLNDVFTEVGGCQQEVSNGDDVLWAYDAFHQRGFLQLQPVGSTSTNPPTTTSVLVGQPLSVLVTLFYGSTASFTPFPGATVAPVTTAANGFETVDTTSSEAVTSDTDGVAEITFNTPGWQSIKATDGAAGPIRSNRLEVCVQATARATCGAPPADTKVTSVKPLPGQTLVPGVTIGAPVIQIPTFTDAGLARGLIGVSWQLLEKGVGVKRWSFASRLAAAKRGPWTARAHGGSGTHALLQLPAGLTWDIRATFTDKRGRTASAVIGSTIVPVSPTAMGVTRIGRWTTVRDRGAWLHTVLRGSTGDALKLNVAAGHPTVLVRDVRSTAEVQVIADGHRQTFRIAGSRNTATREIVAGSRARAARVEVRIVSGTVGVDGISASS
jgi:hypothetical protein